VTQPSNSTAQSSNAQPPNAQPANGLLTRLEGPSPAMEIAVDLIRRAAIWSPLAILVSGAIWGTDGAISAAFALGLVILNFLLSAWMLQAGARISIAVMAGAALFGYLIRLGLILVAVLLVKDQPWLDPVALGVVLIVTHLGLLFWELRYVSGSMAFPGLKPRAGRRSAAVTATQVNLTGNINSPTPDATSSVADAA